MQQTESAISSSASWRIDLFEYPAGGHAPPVPDYSLAGLDGRSGYRQYDRTVEPAERAKHEQKLAEETRRSFEAGRERGRLEGRQAECEAHAAAFVAAEEQRLRHAAALIENFAVERDKYQLAVEHEVVKLALMIAARILRREAQMDPLLLTGAVRVALGQLSDSTQVRLYVPPAELELWTETMLRLPKLAVRPAVVSGDGMRAGECRIETELGSVDLGLRAQLGEIERGFFDRAGATSLTAHGVSTADEALSV